MLDVGQLAKDEKLFDGRYKLLRTLSTDGGTADVWLAIDVNTIDNPDLLGEDKEYASLEDSAVLVAIKVYRPKNALDIEGEQKFREEYKIVHNCRHTNLLQPTNFSIFEGTPYLELPYCKNGSAELLIGRELKANEIWKFIYDVSSGLSYLHACNPPIVHQDIKPANVLIDDYNNYAITDFGISSQRGFQVGYYEDNSGTMAYMAPERFEDNYRPTIASDIWAFGATLYEILTGKVPYQEQGGLNQLDGNMKMKPFASKVPRDIQKLIISCLSLNPEDRPTANQIIELSYKHINPSNNILKYSAILVSIVAVLAIGYNYIKPFSKSVPTQEIFKEALIMLNSGHEEDVRAGVQILDSLSTLNYVPAMYELARTYGWYSDTILLNRKKALGIEFHTDEYHKGMPVSDKFNDKARDLYSKILDINDSTIAKIKANAAYRMATYSANPNAIYSENLVKAKQYLLEAKEYAIIAKDDSILVNVNIAIKRLEDKIRNNN